MKLYRELDLTSFEPWSGAVDTYNTIYNADKLDELEFLLSDLYPEGIEETQLNDLLWFESEWLYDCLGISEEEEDEDEDEEEEETEEDTRFCPYINDTIYCNGICGECGNSKV